LRCLNLFGVTEAASTDLPSSEDEADLKDDDTCGAHELAAGKWT